MKGKFDLTLKVGKKKYGKGFEFDQKDVTDRNFLIQVRHWLQAEYNTLEKLMARINK